MKLPLPVALELQLEVEVAKVAIELQITMLGHRCYTYVLGSSSDDTNPGPQAASATDPRPLAIPDTVAAAVVAAACSWHPWAAHST